jgi:ribulose-phosphate 3-epimerase
MSVNPGFGGQVFIDYVLDKVSEARQMIDASRYAIRLEVDGGIKEDNIAAVAKAGADTFVIGSGLFGCRQIKDPNGYDTVISALSARLTGIHQ